MANPRRLHFLDTNICIFALKGRFPRLTSKLRRSSRRSIRIPSLVEAELRLGAAKSDRPSQTLEVVEAFLEPLEVVPFDHAAAIQYARIRAELERRGTPIGPNDLIIAATVLGRGGTLVTHNISEFSRVPGLVLEDWTE